MARVNLGKDTSGRPLILDDRWLAKLHVAEDRLGFHFVIVQGSWRGSHGAAASGQTHAAGGVGDLRSWNLPPSISIREALTALREAGLIAWYRTKKQGFDPHFHCIDYGNPDLSPSAAAQVRAWERGRNGLARSSEGPDDGPRVRVPKEVPGMPSTPPKPPVQPRAQTTVFGADTSHFQHENGLKIGTLAQQGYAFVMLKCTQGTGWVDPTYPRALSHARTAGMYVAAYHFLEHGNPVAQAANLAAHIGDKSIPVMLDIEPTGKSHPTMADANAFTVAAIKLGLSVTMDYLPEWYWIQLGRPSLAGRRLVASAYPSSKHDYGSRLYPGNRDPHWHAYGNQEPTIWQFTSSGKIDGYGGRVDLDAYRGGPGVEPLKRLFKDYGSPVVSPVPPVVKPAPGMIWNLQFNSRHTDSGPRAALQLRDTVRLADVIGLNEIESPWQRALLKTMTRYAVYPILGSAAAVPIVWNKKRFRLLDSGSVKTCDGVKGITPTRWVNWVYLADTVTGKRFTRVNTQGPHHIDEGGKARIHDQIPGQNGRADVHFHALRNVLQERAKVGPVIWGGDLNVDALADRGATVWFPRSLLGGITTFDLPKSGTHGSRLIDWVGHTGPVKPGTPQVLALGVSDHRAVLTPYTLGTPG